MIKMRNIKFVIFCSVLLLILTCSFFAQTKKRSSEKPTPTPTVQLKTEEDKTEEFSEPKSAGKKNARPAEENVRSNSPAPNVVPAIYTYDFSQPNFLYSHIFIEHDENGKGKITFSKQNFSEEITDPIQLSQATLEKLANIRQALNFLDSKEDYQYEKNYSHLGNMIFTMKNGERMRTAKFNWTENADAKALADEYHKIGNQYIWLFDISVARENQPLESPRIMDALDGLIKRNQISDPNQILPVLKDLSNDERIPLISRNHATRLIAQIEKQTEKTNSKVEKSGN